MISDFYVYNLLELPTLNGIKLLAGSSSIDLPIKTINVMEVPDIYDWSQSHEFLMTTGYSYRNNINFFKELIPKLKAKGVSALGIKTQRFIHEIPESIIECANNYQLPLLELPSHTVFSNVIKEVMENILLSQKETLNIFINNWFHNYYQDIYSLNQQFLKFSLPILLDSPYYMLVGKENTILLQHQYERIIKKLHTIFKNDLCGISFFMYENLLIILVPSSNLIVSKKDLINIFPIFSQLDHILNQYEMNLCLSNQAQSLLDIPDIFKDVLNLHNQSNFHNSIDYYITWDSLGIYSLLSQIPKNDTVNHFVNLYTKVLLEYDEKNNSTLYPTLVSFMESNCNMKETSKILFVHYNTVCYRMKQIKLLTNFDFEDIDTLTNINLAIKLKSILYDRL